MYIQNPYKDSNSFSRSEICGYRFFASSQQEQEDRILLRSCQVTLDLYEVLISDISTLGLLLFFSLSLKKINFYHFCSTNCHIKQKVTRLE